MEFTKMHGCGNDYIYFDCTRQPMDRDLASQLAVRLSDRHFGIGGDGIILIEKGQNADFEMVMYNADGSPGRYVRQRDPLRCKICVRPQADGQDHRDHCVHGCG